LLLMRHNHLLIVTSMSCALLAGCRATAIELDQCSCSLDHPLEHEISAHPTVAEGRPRGAFVVPPAAAERMLAEAHRGRSLPADEVSLGSLAVHFGSLDVTVVGLGREPECDACGLVQVGFAVALTGHAEGALTGRGTVTLAVPLRLEDRHEDGLAVLARFDRATAREAHLELSGGARVDRRELTGVLAGHVVRRYRGTYEPAELLRLGPLAVAGEQVRFSTLRGVLDDEGEDVLELPDGSIAEDLASLVVGDRGLWIVLEL
jgi:hypothetical protein